MIDQYNAIMQQIIQAEYDFNNALANAFKPFVDMAESDISVGDEVYSKYEDFSCPITKMVVLKNHGKTCRVYNLSRMSTDMVSTTNLRKTGKHYDAIPLPEDAEEEGGE